MALTKISSYAVPHDKGNGTGGSTYIMGGSRSSTYNSLNVNSINAKFGNIDNLQSQSISANDGMILYLQSKEGMITKISGDQLDYRNGIIGSLVADDIGVKKLKAEDIEAMNGFIKTLQSREITTEYLTVTKQAHFFELIIDKIRSVGGQLIITPASCITDYVKGYIPGVGLVEPTTSNYDSIDYFIIYWRSEDDNGRAVDNGFIADEHGNDQAICQSFNVHEGTNNNVANKYYWRLVTEVMDDTYINLTTGAETTDPAQAQNNEYNVTMLDTKTKRNENEYYDNGIRWTATEQRIEGIATNVDWINGSSVSGAAINGKFVSASQVYGIQITPDKDNITSYLEFVITQKAGDSTVIPTKINIGVYFKDDTFKIWNDIHIDDDINNYGHCRLDLKDADAAIEAITIVSNADVNWHRCHRMKLSNTDKDQERDGYASIPSAGDNIVQLGYRTKYDNPKDDTNINRQSAIIISAYKSIDQGGVLEDDTIVRPIVAPSYTQYMGIDDFHLYTHRQSFIDGSGARFIGDISLCSVNGKALTDTIQDSVKMILVDTASVMMNTQEGSNTVTSLTPSTINIKMLTVVDDDTVQLDTVPEGYRVQLTYYNASNQVVSNVRYEYNAITPTSLSNISLLMNTDVNAISRLQISLDKVVSVSPEKIIIIDTKEIPYIRTASATTAGRYEFRYCNYIPTQSNPLPVKPDDYSDGIGTFGSQIRCTWNTSVVSPNSANGEYTYMSQCFRNAGGSYGVWTNPIRITGANGKDGEDGSDIEYIYTQNNTGNAPLAPSGTDWGDDWPNVNGSTPSAQDDHGTTWYDNPQGVSSTVQYEYVSMRQKSHGGSWSTYCTPVIWSKWGEKGQDGDGYEYIFRLTDEPSSSNIENPCDVMARVGLNWQTDSTYQSSNEYVTHIPNPDNVAAAYWWMDDPSSVTQSNRYLYVSVRQRKQGVWGKFSDPSLWARYASQGENGGHYEFRYRNAENLTSSDKPTGTGLTNGWSREATNPDINDGEFTWMSQSFVTPATPNDVYGPWTDPVRITGGDGIAGTDGTDIEFVYTVSPTIQNIPAPETNQEDDWHGDSNGWTWYDNPQGVTNIVKYEYMSMRYKTGGHAGVGGTWSDYTTPVVWSAFGEKGTDGDGFEYIYKISGGSSPDSNKPSNPTPSDWATNQSYQSTVTEYVPSGWTDDPQDTTPTNRWQWVCVRKRQNGQWKQFNGPTLWSNYSLAEDAVPGTDGKDAELDLLIPVKELFYADIKTALTNNSKTKVKLNLEYALNKKVGTDVTSQSWSGFTLTFDLYSSTYTKLTSNSVSINTTSGSNRKYTSNDVLYNVLNMSSNSDWLELSSDSSKWANLPAYAEVTLKKNGNVVAEPRVVPLQIDGGAFQLVMDNKIREVVGDSIYNYDGDLNSYLQTSYASREMLSTEVTQKVNTLTMSKSDIDQALSEIRQTANEISLNVTDNYTTTDDLTTRLANAGITIAANNTDGGMINLNGDNVNVNGSLNVYDEAGEGFSVWNGTKDEATKSTQIRNKEIGSVQDWLIANTSGGTSNMKCLNIIGIDGMILGHPATWSTDIYKKFLWWGDTQYDHASGSNGYEFIVRNLYHNFRVSENGIYRTSAQNIFNNWQNLDSFYESEGKDIFTNQDIRSGGAAGANMRWSDASTTTPVCIFSESSKNFTKASAGTTNSKFPDSMFRSCGIFVAQGGNTTIWLPWPDYCIGRTLLFKCVNGDLTLKIAYAQSTGKIMGPDSTDKTNEYNAGGKSIQLVSDGVRWIVF